MNIELSADERNLLMIVLHDARSRLAHSLARQLPSETINLSMPDLHESIAVLSAAAHRAETLDLAIREQHLAFRITKQMQAPQ